jgi:ribonuclease G
MQQEILIHSAHHETRVAVMEHGAVQELHIERHAQRGIVGNVYLGKVIRVLPGMQSAFIDIGVDKAAFLHVADVWHPKPSNANASANAPTCTPTVSVAVTAPQTHDKLSPIEKQIFVGQTLMVQVLKDSLGNKGARLTTQISLAGRYMVLLPQDSHIGLSQKIQGEPQRSALRERLKQALPAGFAFGLIARTQAQDANSGELGNDIQYLQTVWQHACTAAKTQAAPALLHRDANLAQRALRDVCGEQTRAIRVDGADCHQALQQFAALHMPALLDKLHLHTGEHGLFDLAQVDAEVNAALQRRVPLPSGAYLVIDQTESMCTIDVNTGSFVGGKSFADTILNTNLEAVRAIARQLRLRNLGGIILIDFIDMTSDAHRDTVRSELQQQLSKDPVRSQLYGFTALGLMELTRKRVRESLAHVMMHACECCQRSGQSKTPQTVGYEILREIELQARQFDCAGFEVRTTAALTAWFNQAPSDELRLSLEQTIGKSIRICLDSSQSDSGYAVQLLSHAGGLG